MQSLNGLLDIKKMQEAFWQLPNIKVITKSILGWNCWFSEYGELQILLKTHIPSVNDPKKQREFICFSVYFHPI